MGFGMGLGAFAQGLAGGLAIGDALQKSSEERDLKNQIAGATEEVKQQFGDKFGTDEASAALSSRISTIHNKAGRIDDARKAAALSDSFKSRHEETTLKSGLKAASDEASQKFGDGKGGLSDEGYAYMMRKSAAAFVAAGQHEKARDYLKWAEEGETKANTKRFADGLRQIDMGDIDGFDKTLGTLGSAKGYGPQVGVGFARGDDGKIITNKGADGEIYYRMKITPPGAKEPVLQDVPKSKMKDVYARWFNPQSAFEADQAASAGKTKREADLRDYEAKKEIDARFSDPQRAAKDRGEAIDGLRKRDFGGKAFDDLPDTQKETEIQKELGLRRGGIGVSQGGAPGLAGGRGNASPQGRAVVMDRATGQPVKPTAPPAASPGSATAPAQNAAPGLPRAYPTSRETQGFPMAGQQDDELSYLQDEAANLDRQIADTKARSVNPEAAEMLIQPMRVKRAALDMRLRDAQERRGITAQPQQFARPDMAQKSSELESINRQIGDLQNRPGGAEAYRDSIAELEAKKGALLEANTAARRTWR